MNISCLGSVAVHQKPDLFHPEILNFVGFALVYIINLFQLVIPVLGYKFLDAFQLSVSRSCYILYPTFGHVFYIVLGIQCRISAKITVVGIISEAFIDFCHSVESLGVIGVAALRFHKQRDAGLVVYHHLLHNLNQFRMGISAVPVCNVDFMRLVVIDLAVILMIHTLFAMVVEAGTVNIYASNFAAQAFHDGQSQVGKQRGQAIFVHFVHGTSNNVIVKPGAFVLYSQHSLHILGLEEGMSHIQWSRGITESVQDHQGNNLSVCKIPRIIAELGYHGINLFDNPGLPDKRSHQSQMPQVVRRKIFLCNCGHNIPQKR